MSAAEQDVAVPPPSSPIAHPAPRIPRDFRASTILDPLHEEKSSAPISTSMLPTPPSSGTVSPSVHNRVIDFDGLCWPAAGSRTRRADDESQEQARQAKIQDAVTTILECLGEDPERTGLKGTPERYARAMLFFSRGYSESISEVVNDAVFPEESDEMVIIKDIEISSMCEHHLLPFVGKLHIGYIPAGRVLGLSKFARIAAIFSRRLQIQERLTKQIATALGEILQPQGLAVVIESSHCCMMTRGVEQSSSKTTTSCMQGMMRTRDRTRREFLSLLHGR